MEKDIENEVNNKILKVQKIFINRELRPHKKSTNYIDKSINFS